MDTSLDYRISNMDEKTALPRKNGELVFETPWEARAFGMAIALNESGAYPWRDFSAALAAEIAAAEQNNSPSSYYERWLTSLEKLALAGGLVTPEELRARTEEYASGHHDPHHHSKSPPDPLQL